MKIPRKGSLPLGCGAFVIGALPSRDGAGAWALRAVKRRYKHNGHARGSASSGHEDGRLQARTPAFPGIAKSK